MPRIPGFVGPTYTAQSPWADAERCVNLIPSVLDGGTPAVRTVFDPAPGLSVFCDVATTLGITGTIRGELQINGRCFVVCGARFVELSAGMTVLGNYGPITDDGQLASLSTSQTQVFIVSGGVGYSFDLATNVLAPCTAIDSLSVLDIEPSPDGLRITRDQPAIVAISEAGNIVTVTLAGKVPFLVGQNAIIAGLTPAGFNGTFPVLSVVGNTFTYSNPTTGLTGWATGVASKGTTQNVPIISLIWAADVVTITTASPLDTADPQTVTISGCSVPEQNGTWTLLAAPTGNTCTRSSLVATTADYRPTAGTGNYSNASQAYDTSTVTYATGTVNSANAVGDEPDAKSETYSGLPAYTATAGSLTIISSVSVLGSDIARTADIQYTLGGTWFYLYSTAANYSGTDTIALPAGQNLSLIQVAANCGAGPSLHSVTVTHKIQDIKVTATRAVGSAPANVVGGIASAYTLIVKLSPTTDTIPSVGQEITIAGATLSDYDGDYTVLATEQVSTGGVINWYLYCDATAGSYGRADSGGGSITVFGDAPLAAIMGAYCDSYFLRLLPDLKRWGISTLLDCTVWDLSNISMVSVFPDNVVSILADHREVWLFGRSKTVVYYNSGNTFPFDVANGGYIEQGCCAKNTPCRLDNSVFWLGQDDRGGVMAWRADGYLPKRVSNHAIEYAWAQYSTVSDAVSWNYQENGHTFWVIQFPTANATWVYDASTQLWTERGTWNGITYDAHPAICHTYAFGKHLVGSRTDGKVYQLSTANPDDAGTSIRWLRRFPWISDVGKWVTHQKLQIMAEAGMAINDAAPTIRLRWSDDGCHTWSNNYSLSLGVAGQYTMRAVRYALGRSRARAYEISGTSPVRITDAYLNELSA